MHTLSVVKKDYLCLIEAVLDKPPTLVSLRSLSDKQVKKCVFQKMTEKDSGNQDRQRQLVALVTCAGCGKEEQVMNVFKKCTRCLQVYHCGRECQAGHWETHKKACSKKSKTEI